MNDITYIFGAGASCKAMPLVNNFQKRFQIFIDFIDGQFTFNELLNDSVKFNEEIKSHATFDTLFKKLFHQGQDSEIQKYKAVLLIYFLFEHLFTHEDLLLENKDNDKQFKYYTLDPRYEALIAGLIKPKKGVIDFYQNVNFITWNYDANLLKALRNFTDPKTELNDFIVNKRSDSEFSVTEQVKVFHLNGFVSHEVLNDSQQTDKKEAFNKLLLKYGKPSLGQYTDEIKFAWEQDLDYFKTLANVIQRSKNIVCVGYSFPLYNRIFDSHIFNYENFKGKNIFIQNLDITGVKNIIESDFDIRFMEHIENEIAITYSDNADSFLVPNNVFS